MSGVRHGLARVLSKLGCCSRAEAWRRIEAGRVRVNGSVCRHPERPTDPDRDRLEMDGRPVKAEQEVYLMLNKPRGLVTTASDEQGRPTVYQCFAQPAWGGEPPAGPLPTLHPVGRLDRASEGLLLFTNDTAWSARLTDPASGVPKTYHVQVGVVADEAWAARLVEGVEEGGERLVAREARVLRVGGRHAWLEVVLTEGRNRHLRRMMLALGVEVLRLVRVRVGTLELGELPKGRFRRLTPAEVAALG